jgi:hypothetical protein
MLETIIFGAVLVGMYAVHGSAVIPAMTGGAAAVLLLIFAAAFAVKKNSARAKDLALKAAVLTGFAALISAAVFLNAGKAARGAERIAAACEAYKAKTGAYPVSLEALVPEYLPSVPRAKATVMWAQYRLGGNKVLYPLDPWVMLAGYYDLASKKPGFARIDEMLPAK